MTTPEHKPHAMLWSRVGWRSLYRQLATDAERRLERRRLAREAAGLVAALIVGIVGLERLGVPESDTAVILRSWGALLLVAVLALAVGCAIAGRRFPFDPRR